MHPFNFSLLLFSVPFPTGCAAMGALAGTGQIASVAMEMTGVKKQQAPAIVESQRPARNVLLRLHAGANANAAMDGKPASILVRLYELKQPDSFRRASYAAFVDQNREREVLGADLIEVREILLLPRQRLEVLEKISHEASHVGVVALLRAPSAMRWKATFSVADAEAAGITLGIHACAISSGSGAAPLENLADRRPGMTNPCGQ